MAEPTAIDDVKVLIPQRFVDTRGSFWEAYNKQRFAQAGILADFVQDNYSVSRLKGTVRGLHYQRPPFAQAKLVQVMRGRIFDVAVDIRRGSPTFGHHVAVELSIANGRQLFIPAGFAHGFCALEPDTEVFYKIDTYYTPEAECGIRWDDPDLAISWPLDGLDPLISSRDRVLPLFCEMPHDFYYSTR